MWIFGYGSLMFRVDFPYEEKLTGYITGFQRKFYQYSIDHRGTPERPGRVVTLLQGEPDARVYGIAYRIKDENTTEVITHLDQREGCGYDRKEVTFHPTQTDREPFEIVVYLGNESNPQYAGTASLAEIAGEIATSVGATGLNTEYIFSLANVMRDVFPDVEDDHLFKLETEVRKLVGTTAGNVLTK